MSKEHTPTPWWAAETNGNYSIQKEGEHRAYFNEIIADRLSKEDAEFIVKACNNHDRLVKALERSNKELQKIVRLAWDNDYLQTDLDKALNQTREVNKLLAELKS